MGLRPRRSGCSPVRFLPVAGLCSGGVGGAHGLRGGLVHAFSRGQANGREQFAPFVRVRPGEPNDDGYGDSHTLQSLGDALGDDVSAAKSQAYALVDRISWQGMQCRRDIGFRAIERERSRQGR